MKLRNKKTGDIIESEYMMLVQITSTKGERNLLFEDLTQFNNEWEDYKPTEPLIKLPDVRKAIRAWAFVQRIKEVKYIEGIASSDFRHMFEYGSRGTNRGIIHWGKGILLSGLEDGKTYSITELCGEEKE